MSCSDGDTYEVEQILKVRVRQERDFQYLCKWKGYPASENTWEPHTGIVDDGLIDAFEASNRCPKSKRRKKKTAPKPRSPPDTPNKGEAKKKSRLSPSDQTAPATQVTRCTHCVSDCPLLMLPVLSQNPTKTVPKPKTNPTVPQPANLASTVADTASSSEDEGPLASMHLPPLPPRAEGPSVATAEDLAKAFEEAGEEFSDDHSSEVLFSDDEHDSDHTIDAGELLQEDSDDSAVEDEAAQRRRERELDQSNKAKQRKEKEEKTLQRMQREMDECYQREQQENEEREVERLERERIEQEQLEEQNKQDRMREEEAAKDEERLRQFKEAGIPTTALTMTGKILQSVAAKEIRDRPMGTVCCINPETVQHHMPNAILEVEGRDRPYVAHMGRDHVGIPNEDGTGYDVFGFVSKTATVDPNDPTESTFLPVVIDLVSTWPKLSKNPAAATSEDGKRGWTCGQHASNGLCHQLLPKHGWVIFDGSDEQRFATGRFIVTLKTLKPLKEQHGWFCDPKTVASQSFEWNTIATDAVRYQVVTASLFSYVIDWLQTRASAGEFPTSSALEKVEVRMHASCKKYLGLCFTKTKVGNNDLGFGFYPTKHIYKLPLSQGVQALQSAAAARALEARKVHASSERASRAFRPQDKHSLVSASVAKLKAASKGNSKGGKGKGRSEPSVVLKFGAKSKPTPSETSAASTSSHSNTRRSHSRHKHLGESKTDPVNVDNESHVFSEPAPESANWRGRDDVSESQHSTSSSTPAPPHIAKDLKESAEYRCMAQQYEEANIKATAFERQLNEARVSAPSPNTSCTHA